MITPSSTLSRSLSHVSVPMTSFSTSIDEVTPYSPLTGGSAYPIAHPVGRREGGIFVQPVEYFSVPVVVYLTADVS